METVAKRAVEGFSSTGVHGEGSEANLATARRRLTLAAMSANFTDMTQQAVTGECVLFLVSAFLGGKFNFRRRIVVFFLVRKIECERSLSFVSSRASFVYFPD